LPERVYVRRDGCSSKQLLKDNLAAQGKSLNDFKTVVTSDDLRLTIQNVLTGTGISFLSRSLVAGELARGELVAFHVSGFDHYRRRTAALLRSRLDDPVVGRFLSCLFEEFNVDQRRPAADGPVGT